MPENNDALTALSSLTEEINSFEVQQFENGFNRSEEEAKAVQLRRAGFAEGLGRLSTEALGSDLHGKVAFLELEQRLGEVKAAYLALIKWEPYWEVAWRRQEMSVPDDLRVQRRRESRELLFGVTLGPALRAGKRLFNLVQAVVPRAAAVGRRYGPLPGGSVPGDAKTLTPRFENWAVGIEHSDVWHVFKKFGDGWRHQGRLQNLSLGRQSEILKAFAEGGGFLSDHNALTQVRRTYGESDHKRIMKILKPQISHLRHVLGAATQVTNSKADPLPRDRQLHGWQSRIYIGYAIEVGGKLQFRTREQLSGDEALDAGP
jgi:hypothetical protein